MSDSKDLIYLDHAAATPIRPAAAQAQARAYDDAPGNPGSLGRPGRHAARVLRRAREDLARALGLPPEGLIFTSGGTEAVGQAILGSLAHRQGGHVVASAIEHPAVLDSLTLAERRGFEVTLVRPEPSGVMDPKRFAKAVSGQTTMACLMHVNNELGTIQPLAEAFAAVKARAPRCLTFTDCVQSAGRLPLEPAAWQADLLALSGHKLGGPRGIGALMATGYRPSRLFGGGDQEDGHRPGTQNVPGAVGFAAAAVEASAQTEVRLTQAAALAEALGTSLREQVPAATFNGPAALDDPRRLPYILSISVPGLPSEALLRGLEELGVIVSAGSACHARSQKQSHVLKALRTNPALATMRVSFGAEHRVDQMPRVAQALATTLERYALS